MIAWSAVDCDIKLCELLWALSLKILIGVPIEIFEDQIVFCKTADQPIKR